MKMKSIFLSMLAIAALASCTTENFNIDPPGPGTGTQEGDEMVVELNISSGAMGTKAGTVGQEAKNGGDKKIKDITVFGVSDAGTIITKQYFASGSGLNEDDPTTMISSATFVTTDQTKDIYVIANIGADLTKKGSPNGQFYSINTLKQLQAATVSLLDGTDPKQQEGNVLMSGTGNVTELTPGDGKKTAKASVQLSFIASKIILEALNRGEQSAGTYDTDFTIDAAIMTHVNTAAYYLMGDNNSFVGAITADNVRNQITPVFATGLTGPDAGGETTIGDFKQAISVAAFDNQNPIKNIGYWYVFENPSESTHTTLSIEYQYKADGQTMSKHYFPVTFDGLDKPKIEPGKAYKVTLTFNGSFLPGEGGSGGTDKPDESIVSTDVAVTVTPADWGEGTVVNKPFGGGGTTPAP